MSLSNAAAVLNYNVIRGNSSFAVFNSTSSIFVDARFNNWGHPCGPLDPSDDRGTGGLYNPGGLGNRVSDFVNYSQWTGSTPATTAVPTGLRATPRDSALDLTWNANTEADLFGYRIFYGSSSRNYEFVKTVGRVTSHRLTEITNGTTYFIAIASLNTLGAESDKSAEVSATPAVVPPPVIANLSPTSGQAGSLARISGSRFGPSQDTSRATLGGVSRLVRSWSDTVIEAVIPPLSPGSYNVAVVTAGGPSNPQAFTITQASPSTVAGGPGSNPNAPFSREPINLATGAYFYQATDLTLPARGLPLVFFRTYNSSSGTAGAFGPD